MTRIISTPFKPNEPWSVNVMRRNVTKIKWARLNFIYYFRTPYTLKMTRLEKQMNVSIQNKKCIPIGDIDLNT